jgi:hypothetical protein
MSRFTDLLDEIRALHDKKSKDYGSGTDPLANLRASRAFGVPPWVAAAVRLNDKVHRVAEFARKGSLANESVEDSLRDISVYALLTLVLYEEEGAACRRPAGTAIRSTAGSRTRKRSTRRRK